MSWCLGRGQERTFLQQCAICGNESKDVEQSWKSQKGEELSINIEKDRNSSQKIETTNISIFERKPKARKAKTSQKDPHIQNYRILGRFASRSLGENFNHWPVIGLFLNHKHNRSESIYSNIEQFYFDMQLRAKDEWTGDASEVLVEKEDRKKIPFGNGNWEFLDIFWSFSISIALLKFQCELELNIDLNSPAPKSQDQLARKSFQHLLTQMTNSRWNCHFAALKVLAVRGALTSHGITGWKWTLMNFVCPSHQYWFYQ